MDHCETTYIESFINKIQLRNDEKSFAIVASFWTNKEVEFKILEYADPCSLSSKEWYGVLLIDSIKVFFYGSFKSTWWIIISFQIFQETAEALEIDFDEFYNETKTAICTQNGLSNFRYSIEIDEFVVRKLDKYENKIKYCLIKLKPTSNLKDTILIQSLNLISELRDENEKKSKQSIYIKNQHDLIVEKCAKIVKENSEKEKILLSKFLELLNAKKDKITELQNLVSKHETNNKIITTSNFLSDSDDMSLNEISITEPIPSSHKRTPERSNCLSQSSQSEELVYTNSNVPKRAKLTVENKSQLRNFRKSPDTNLFTGLNINVNIDIEKDKYDVDTQKMFDEI